MSTQVSILSLGCDKNLVDAEVMLGLLQDAGCTIVVDENEADVIIVNTCCFIEDALQESINAIIELAACKQERCKALIVAGCMAQRYQDEVFKEIPEVDAIVGTVNYTEIVSIIENVLQQGKLKALSEIHSPLAEADLSRRKRASIQPYAYIKVAEGCDNHCTYCVIPSLRGRYRSRSIESIVEEARRLGQEGVKEVVLIAQDTACYGIDLYKENKLAELLRQIAAIEEIHWIRLMYCYPEHITEDLIDVLATEKKVLPYLDIPMQHAADSVLKRMGRKSTQAQMIQLIESLREKVPDIVIRTSLIVGFPQETQEEFQTLLSFIDQMELDRVGVFCFSSQEGTPAHDMTGQIDDEEKERRKDIIMRTQQIISREKNKKEIGKKLEVHVEGFLPEEQVYIGRSYKDAPDVDGYVFIETDEKLMSGDFVQVEILDAKEYDLVGRKI